MNQSIQSLNKEQKLSEWVSRISACRASGESVKSWCQENGISEPSYYKWQKRVFEMAKAEQQSHFAEITTKLPGTDIAVTIQIHGAEVQVHNGADTSTVEAVLQILKSC